MLSIAHFSNFSKEFVNLLVNLVTILTNSAVSHLDKLLFKDLEVIVEPLHHVYYYRS